MRQMACHPDLVLKSKTSSLAQPTTEGTICRICNDAAEDAIVSQCHHVFDRECIRQYLEMQQLRGHNVSWNKRLKADDSLSAPSATSRFRST